MVHSGICYLLVSVIHTYSCKESKDDMTVNMNGKKPLNQLMDYSIQKVRFLNFISPNRFLNF